MKKIILIYCLIISCCKAQNKLFSMEDAFINNRTTLAPANLKQLQFIGGSNEYVYVAIKNGVEVWMKGSFGMQETEFLNLINFNASMRKASLDTFKVFPMMQFGKSAISFYSKGAKCNYNYSDAIVSVLVSKELSARTNLDESSGGYFAYLKDDNLFVEKNGTAKQVTNDGSVNIVYASAVHQSEFGITKGTYWSNNGDKLAFYRMDQHMVPDYPIIDWSTRPAKVNNIRYPMAGDSSHIVTVGIYNTLSNQLVYINTGLPYDQYLTNIAWSADDASVFIAIVNREQNHMWLNEYNATTGAFIKTLFEEINDKYVEPLKPILFLKHDSDKFIWQSRGDGWNHLYLYNRSGTLLKQLTSGKWDVVDVKGFDEKGDRFFFTGTTETPLGRNICVLNLKNYSWIKLCNDDRVHTPLISTSGDYVIDNYSATNIPRMIDIIEVKSGKKKNILNAANPIATYAQIELNLFSVKNDAGDDLYCRMYKPFNFDSSKKYPVIIYWYGGPHVQLITNSWNGGAGDYWFRYMAQRGFLVFSMDVRGSANRGRNFEQAIFRYPGKAQMEDLMSGIKYLKSLQYVDEKKIGLNGWSYGGFLTTSFLLNYPGIIKAAVAGGPVMNWQFYEIMYTERYMDKPVENPEGYAYSDLINKAGNLKDKLLIIHGLQDPVVVQQHSVKFVRAAIDKNVQVDYMIYPGHEHNVTGKDRAHLFQKITDYFLQYLN